MGGTSPKVLVQYATGIRWRVKGGRDVQPEAFITRFVRALGYYSETTYFFAEGRIDKVPELKRASSSSSRMAVSPGPVLRRSNPTRSSRARGVGLMRNLRTRAS